MDSLVGIKFRPIIKRIEKQPECCIEIIPEISYVKHFDSLKFTESNGCLQYTLPVTYKIIVKKKMNVEKTDKQNLSKQNKTYHSCIDLLRSSSNVSENLTIGDVFRKTSDNYFLSKLAKCDVELNNTKQDFKTVDTSYLCNSAFNNYLTKNIDKLEHITKKIKTNNENTPMKNRLPYYPSEDHTLKEFTKTSLKTNYKAPDMLFRSEHVMLKGQNEARLHTTQVRIARNLAKLETEMNPLKEMLDDILRKCNQNIRLQKVKKLIKNNKYCFDDIKYRRWQSIQTQKILADEKNRVLYSIVCDV